MRLKVFVLVLLLSLIAVLPTLAQDTPPIPDDVDTSNITADEVNEVANQLYCPVCENIPLSTCSTAACEDWRDEIRGMLATGMSKEDIVDNFVVRFGDRVVSSPRDPVIAAISNITPWLVLLIIAGFALYQLTQWNQKKKVSPVRDLQEDEDDTAQKRNRYLEQLENDLSGK